MTATSHLPRRVLALASCFSLLAGCGRVATDASTDANTDAVANPVVPAPEPAADATLTTIPPLNVEYPELFNEQGCAISQVIPALDDLSTAAQTEILKALPPEAQAQIKANGQVDLNSLPPGQLGSLLEAQSTEVADCNMTGETPRSPWEFYGYVGHSAHHLAPGTVQSTLVGTPDHTWRVRGLAAAPSEQGGTVTITATLIDAGGAVLGQARNESPVRGARSGEPVPFEVASDIPADAVAKVDYAVTDDGVGAKRELIITIEDVLADGNNSVVLGNVNNASNNAIAKPAGVVAVVGTDDQVADIVKFVVNEPGSTREVQQLQPGLSGTFEVIIADPEHRLTTSGVQAWAFGS